MEKNKNKRKKGENEYKNYIKMKKNYKKQIPNRTLDSEYSIISVFGILPNGTNPLSPGVEIPVKIGACFPKACSAFDIEQILSGINLEYPN